MSNRAWRLVLLILLVGCGEDAPRLPKLLPDDVIVAFGDSLTFGTGANSEEAYPAVLERLIRHEVINSGVPGETTGEALRRLPEVLEKHQPRLVLLCLGGNDLLHRLDEKQAAENLRAMVRLIKHQDAEAVLIGVPELRPLGGAPEFYAEIAEEFHLPFEARIMNEVLKNPALKSDPIHANSAGYRRIAERLAELLKASGAI